MKKNLNMKNAKRIARVLLIFTCAVGSLVMVGFVMFP